MTITIHESFMQGSDEWMACRRGTLTASEMKLIITPTLKIASNEKEKTHLYELLAQRVTGHVEPQYVSDAMLRGMDEEIEARAKYAELYAPVEEVGFVTNDKWGFTIGCSPDGLVGKDGGLECKSRMQKYQIRTLVEDVTNQTTPEEFMLQVQTCLLVTERAWWDFISYSGGMHMAVIRAYPDEKVHTAIVEAASAFEARLAEKLATYKTLTDSAVENRLTPTERKIEQEMYV